MRVIAGRFRGRSLRAPKGRATRPTSDRVREALFSMLGDLEGLRVLDLYAGTGALGIEALSRGAVWATFVESQRAALAALRENLRALDLEDETHVAAQPVERAAGAIRAHAPYQLSLCDPPWADIDRATKALAKLLDPPVFPAGARIVLEHSARDSSPIVASKNLALVERRAWGDTAVSVFVVP